MLVEAFRLKIFPYIMQLAVILFVFSMAQYGYALFRNPDWARFFEKFKAAVFGYVIVSGAFVIVGFIDTIITTM